MANVANGTLETSRNRCWYTSRSRDDEVLEEAPPIRSAVLTPLASDASCPGLRE
jgi:hypothetical protein